GRGGTAGGAAHPEGHSGRPGVLPSPEIQRRTSFFQNLGRGRLLAERTPASGIPDFTERFPGNATGKTATFSRFVAPRLQLQAEPDPAYSAPAGCGRYPVPGNTCCR